MRVIYEGGQIPDLAVEENPEYRMFGWLFYRHPDGHWVSLADLKDHVPITLDMKATAFDLALALRTKAVVKDILKRDPTDEETAKALDLYKPVLTSLHRLINICRSIAVTFNNEEANINELVAKLNDLMEES